MKPKIIVLVFVLSHVCMVCSAQDAHQKSLKDSLIAALIHSPDVQSSKTNGQLIILKTQHCTDFDCEVYFQDYSDQIQLYWREDAFMRGITNYIEIEKLDEAKGYILLNQ
ncbi:MAG: hypothetical protein WAU01_05980, partial [Saprospiraceae bacterium]